jgi:hypothetical protein
MDKFDTVELHQYHDAKLGIITYNYRNKSVSINLDMDSDNYKGPFVFVANEVSLIESKIIEPWGIGIYISKLVVINIDGLLEIAIQLNSGDIINIKCKKYSLVEKA